MTENAESRSDDAENIEAGGTAVPPVSPAPANDIEVDNSGPANDAAAIEAPQAQDEPDAALVAMEPIKRRKPAVEERALEDMVRRGDEDRWLASRFAPAPVRKKLIALYAFNLEIASIVDKVTDPRLGEIRLQWWRDTVEAIFQGGLVPDHPTARALADVISEAHLPLGLFDELLTARVLDLNPAPFETWADLDAYVDGAEGALMRMAAILCAPDLPASPRRAMGLQTASRAWGYLSLLRALPAWAARGRTFYPANLRGNLGIGGKTTPQDKDEASFAFAAHAILDRAVGAQKNLSRYAELFPKEVYPAIGYVALAPLYIRAQAERELGRPVKAPSLFKRQWRLVFAAMRGALS